MNTIILHFRQLMELLRLRPFDVSSVEGRAKERHRRAVLSAAATAAAKAVSVTTALISIPLTLHYLGAERYGMWLTMSSFVAMLSFADFGIGNGLLNAVAQANGKDDRVLIRRLVSSAFFVLSGIALFGGLVVTVLYPIVPWSRLFNVGASLAESEAGPAVAILLACFLLAIPLGVVQKTQTGLQQGFSASLWQCAASLLSMGCLLLAIHIKLGLPWLVLALVGAPLVASASNAIVFFGAQASDIAPSLNLVSRSDMARIAHAGMLFLVLQVVMAAAYSSDNVVIAQILGAARVPDYAVPAQMFNLVSVVIAMGLTPLWPAYGEALARGDRVWVRQTFVRSMVAAISLSSIASIALVIVGPSLLKLWVGQVGDPPFLLLFGLGLWKIIEAGGNATAMLLNGANVISFQMLSATLMGAAAITLKIVLVTYVAVAGVVWATIIAYVIFTAMPLSYIVWRMLAVTEPTPESSAQLSE